MVLKPASGIPSKAQFADQLRKKMTPAEQLLWTRLKPHGFLPQQIIRGYIPDFFHPGRRLIVEVDGGIHKSQRGYDATRDGRLRESGYAVVRVTNDQVFFSLDKVCKMLLN